MWINFYVVFFILLSLVSTNGGDRQKRYLVFTTATQYGAFAAISIPLPPETTVSLSWFFEANYYNVDNTTYLEPLLGDIIFDGRKRTKRNPEAQILVTRNRLYTFIESMLMKHDYPGRPCLLRSICESGMSHFGHNGILGDLIQLVLTPSTSISEDSLKDCYYEAEYYGTEGDCTYYIEECPSNPLDSIFLHAA